MFDHKRYTKQRFLAQAVILVRIKPKIEFSSNVVLSSPNAIFCCNTFVILRILKVTAPKMFCLANFRKQEVKISVGFLVAKSVMVRGSWPCI